MRKFFFSVIAFIFSLHGFSQSDTGKRIPDSLRVWKKGGVGALNFSQAAFSNWAAGGENALSGAALFNFFVNYKSDDKIDFTSKWGYKVDKKLFYAVLVNFKSQFSPGYNYPNDSILISDFLAPASILVSTGIDYKPNDDFSCFISPATGKITIVNNQTLADAGAYGVSAALFDTAGVQVAEGKKIRYEFGALLSVKFNKEIAKNITLSTKADFFSNYFKNPQNIDVNWDFLLNMKVNKYLVASISTTLVYDHDIPVAVYNDVAGVKTQVGTGPRTQLKEVFAIGFSYKF